MLCRKHLLGEQNEIHKHRHNSVKRHSVSGRVAAGQIEPASMWRRHEELVAEMLRRGYRHASPYEQPDISYLPTAEQTAVVDVRLSKGDLSARCPECEQRMKQCQ